MSDGANTKEKVRLGIGTGIAWEGGCYLKPGGLGRLVELVTSV